MKFSHHQKVRIAGPAWRWGNRWGIWPLGVVLIAGCMLGGEPARADERPELKPGGAVGEAAFRAQGSRWNGGFLLGVGIDLHGSDRPSSHSLVATSVQLAYALKDPGRGPAWGRSRLEMVGQLLADAQWAPDGAYLVGLMPLIRYNVATGTRWMPFVEGGAGVSLTDIGLPDLSTHFQFLEELGLGVHWFVRDNLSVTLQGHYMHVSNASIRQPNDGLDILKAQLGFSWFF